MHTNNSTYHDNSSVRFKRYSRKSYASFASIGRIITIGTLSAQIADAQMLKSKTPSLDHTASQLSTTSALIDKDDNKDTPLTLSSIIAILTLENTNNEAAAKAASLHTHTNIYREQNATDVVFCSLFFIYSNN